MTDKVRENLMRRMAKRQGLELTKSRTRDERALDYGVYWLSNPNDNNLIITPEQGIDLDEVELWLRDVATDQIEDDIENLRADLDDARHAITALELKLPAAIEAAPDGSALLGAIAVKIRKIFRAIDECEAKLGDRL
jgi:hypothetical protein